MMAQINTGDASHSYIFAILKIQDGGGRHFEKSKNRNISTTVYAIAANFGRVTQFDPRYRLVRYKFEI